HFVVGQVEAAGFDNVRVGISEQLRVGDPDHVGVWENTKVREPLYSSHVLAIGARTIHRPSHTFFRKPAAPAKFRTSEISRDEAAPAAASVLGVCETCEEKFGRTVRGWSICQHEELNEPRGYDETER